MEFEVKRNEYTGGWFCKFEHNGEKLYADLSNVPFTGPECMIFGCEPSGSVDFGDERYIARGGAVSKEALVDHIKKFIEEEEVSEDGED
jgi:hypothetical protein